MFGGLRKSVRGALGGGGMGSAFANWASASSMNSTIEGKGRMTPGLLVSLWRSNTVAAATGAAT